MSSGKAFKIFFSLIFSSIIVLSLATYIISQPKFDDGTRERSVIQLLLSQGYCFVLPRDYFNGDNKGKIALLLHDIDFTWSGQDKFVSIESSLGVKSCFLPRYIQVMGSIDDGHYCINLENKGFEVGFQYECLSSEDGNLTAANLLFSEQLHMLRNFLNISTTDYHGDVNKPNIFNLDLYNATLWHSLGLNEIYKLQNFSYFTDTNNHLVFPPTPYENLVIVQLHTDWTR